MAKMAHCGPGSMVATVSGMGKGGWEGKGYAMCTSSTGAWGWGYKGGTALHGAQDSKEQGLPVRTSGRPPAPFWV